MHVDPGPFLVLTLKQQPTESARPIAPTLINGDNVSEASTQRPLPTFHSLSDEIINYIFDFLPAKHHQRTLCLCNRRTYNLLLSRLYECIHINLSRYPHSLSSLHALLNEKNPGLQYIQHLEFFLNSEGPSTRAPAGVDNVAQMFIRALPEDQLKTFSWPSEVSLHPLTTRALWEAQMSLENVQLYDLTWQVAEAKVTNTIKDLKGLKELRLTPDTSAGLKNSNLILKNRPITSLHLDLRTLSPPMGDGEYNTSGVVKDGVTNIIFLHLLPLERCKTPIKLVRLTLWSVNLFHSPKTFLKAIDLSTLKHLELIRCPHAGRFMLGLTGASAAERPMLQSLVVAHYSQGPPDEEITDGINNYLAGGVRDTLKVLWLRLRGHAGVPFAQAVARHGASLERLNLDVCEAQARRSLPDPVVIRYRLNELVELLGAMTPKLRQLGLGFEYWGSDTFGQSIVDAELKRVLELILTHTRVTTLNLTGVHSSPAESLHSSSSHSSGSDQSSNHPDHDRRMRSLELRQLAEDIFQHAAARPASRNHLRVLAFRATAANRGVGAPVCFARGSVEVLERRREVAVPVSLRELVRVGEEVDILVAEAGVVEGRV